MTSEGTASTAAKPVPTASGPDPAKVRAHPAQEHDAQPHEEQQCAAETGTATAL